MVSRIYAGATVNGMVELPSPDEINQTSELIWSENTGRSQQSSDKAKMIGDVVGEKDTYEIKWGIITAADYRRIKTYLTKGFFYFAIGTSLSEAKAAAKKFYRSEIAGGIVPSIDSVIRYKGVQVSVIEQ